MKGQYLAFISHRCNGEGLAAAERLVRFLRSFRLPRVLHQKYPLMRGELTPFYYSRDSLSVINLFDEMPLHLAASEFLIVVCTPDYAIPSPASGRCYADIAVASFLGWEVSSSEPHGIPLSEIPALVASADSERKKRIIPVICRSGKDGVRAEDCLSPVLKALNCIGPDMGTDGEDRVFNAVAARLLGVELEELYSRWKVREQRRRLLARVVAVAACATLACFGGWSWSYYVPRMSYFADYIEINGIPEGVHPLSAQEAKQRFFHYRFVYRYHKLCEVRRENSYGRLFTAPVVGSVDRPSAITLEYTSEGKLFRQIQTREEGKPQAVLTFDNQLRYVRTQTQNSLKAASDSMLVPAMGKPGLLHGQGDAVTGYHRSYDEQGRITQERFLNVVGEPVCSESGAWGRCFLYEGRGLLAAWYYTDEHGEISNNRSGIAGQVYRRDAEGNVISVTYVNAERKPVYREDGISEMRLRWSKSGIVCTEFYDTEGRPCLNSDGYHRQRLTFSDRDGMVCRRSMEDTSGKPVRWSGEACSIAYEYDAKGRERRATYCDAEGKPCLNSEGYCSVVADYEDHVDGGYVFKEYFLDAENKPCRPGRKQYAAQTHWHDANGYLTAQSYFDVNGHPCRVDGAARVEFKRDAQGVAVERTTYDENGSPCISDNGVCTIHSSRDGWGNVTELCYFDEMGRPCVNGAGISRVRYHYNDAHKLDSLIRFGLDSTPCDPTDGSACREYAEYRDKYGHCTATERRNKEGAPVANEYGVSRYEMQYDDRGNLAEMLEFEPDGQGGQRLCAFRPACTRYAYDERGRVMSEAFYDAVQSPTMSENGFHLRCVRYDENGKEVEEEFFDVSFAPVVNRLGYASVRYAYDERGNRTRVTYFDASGEKGSAAGPIAELEYAYNAAGERISLRAYDKSGKLIYSR